MTTHFKTRFWRIGKWFGGLFVLLFIFRLIYGYVAVQTAYDNFYADNFFSSIDNLRKNYASEKISMKGDVQVQANISASQKFEKTASVKTQSSEFEKAEKAIKSQTKEYNSVIQYEQNLGQKGSRQLHLLIGVNPAMFEEFYDKVQKIGILKATEIIKVDKTNEYRQLNAKKISIEKTLNSLNELKSKNGQIADFVALNDKILEIEEKLQELGVELGNFDAENEFCTVKFSLYESAAKQEISLIHRVKVALEWTIKYFALFVLISLGLAMLIYIILRILDWLKIMEN